MPEKSKIINIHERYRWFYTANNILVVGGKSDSQNEEVLKSYNKPEYTVVHTTNPGSPFMVIINKSPDKDDIIEASILDNKFKRSSLSFGS